MLLKAKTKQNVDEKEALLRGALKVSHSPLAKMTGFR